MLPTPKVLGAVSTPKVFGAGGSSVKTVSAKIGTVKNNLVPFLGEKKCSDKMGRFRIISSSWISGKRYSAE